jgi:hypothetical protein
MSKKRNINAIGFHFTSALTDKAPVVKFDLYTKSFKENLEFRTAMEKQGKLHDDSKFRVNTHWLKLLNRLNPGERIITQHRNNEVIEIVVDEFGRFKRIL